jgi:hypothetical protein
MPRDHSVSRAAVWVAVLGLAGVLSSTPRAARAEEAPAPYAKDLADLASGEAAARVAAVQRVAADYATGTRLAQVLADLALEDADADVRQAATDAVERLAEASLLAWMRYLAEVDTGRYPEFGRVAEKLVREERGARPGDVVAGLAASKTDVAVAGVAGAAALLVAWHGTAERDVTPGLDVLLERQLDAARPLTAEVAPACLALLASAALRDRGTGAPGSLERPNLTAADVRPFLGAPKAGAKRPPGLTEALCTVMGAAARPDAEALALLAKAAETSHHAVAALARLGGYASSLGLDLRAKLPPTLPGRSLLLARLGQPESALPAKPHELKTEFESAKGPDPATVVLFARETRSLSARHAELARRAVPALLYIARGDFKTPLETRIDAIDALGRAGRLSPHALELMRELAAKRRAPAKRAGTAKDAAEAEAESASERAGGHAYLALLRGAADPGPEMAALGDVLDDPRETDWGTELRRALPGLAARVVPARSALVGLAALEGRRDPAGLSTRVAVLRTLRRLPDHDAGEASALRRYVESGAGSQTTRDLETKELAKAFVTLGPVLALGIEARRAAVDGLAACGPLAKDAAPTLEALRKDRDLVLRWRVERALRAIQG